MGISSRRRGPEGLHYPLVTEVENCVKSDLSALQPQRFPVFVAALKQAACHSHSAMAKLDPDEGIKEINVPDSGALSPPGHRTGQGGRDVPAPFSMVDQCQLV